MIDLATFLSSHRTDAALHDPVSRSILALAAAASEIAGLIRDPTASAGFGSVRGSSNADGDSQKALDVICDERVTEALAGVGTVAAYLSEEQEAPIDLAEDGEVIVACDPLDGSSNIDTNTSIGTIFSVLPASGGILQAGCNQIAAGFFVYGPQTSLLLTLGDGVHAFQMDPTGRFVLLDWQIAIPTDTSEFAINSTNSRHWHPPVAHYIADCLAGDTGRRGRNFNMRWVGSLVADSWRIFRRGGVFLYPVDSRPAYQTGRLRLVYEAAPVAFLVEQAGGKASTGSVDILDIVPEKLHQRVPLIFGSANEIDVINGYHA